MRRAICLLMALWLCLPFFAWAEEGQDDPGERVNRALLVGCDRFLSQQATTPSAWPRRSPGAHCSWRPS